MIEFRPHHFLCTMNFQGKGYSAGFVAGYQEIVEQIKENPDQKIRIVEVTDSICAPCPHRRGKLCEQQEKISALDRRHEEALGFIPGEEISWNEAVLQIRERISVATFHSICHGCKWKAFGMCEAGVIQLLTKKRDPLLNKDVESKTPC